MTPDSITVPDEVLVAELAGEAVLLHSGTKRYFRLNETGAWIWEGIQKGLSGDALVEHVRARFDVDAATAREEVRRLLDELRDADLVRTAES